MRTNACEWADRFYEVLVPLNDEKPMEILEIDCRIITKPRSEKYIETEVTTQYQKNPINKNFRNIIYYYRETSSWDKLNQYCDVYINHGKDPEIVYVCLM